MKKVLLIGSILAIAGFVLILPTSAQDDELEVIPVSGTYNYTPEMVAQGLAAAQMDAASNTLEEWSGDFGGTAESVCRFTVTPTGIFDGPCITKFEGKVLGDKQGTMVIVFDYTRMSANAEWFGDWWIISGTGDLANIHGKGVVWGPGFNPEDLEGEPDIFYSGEVVFVEPMTE